MRPGLLALATLALALAIHAEECDPGSGGQTPPQTDPSQGGPVTPQPDPGQGESRDQTAGGTESTYAPWGVWDPLLQADLLLAQTWTEVSAHGFDSEDPGLQIDAPPAGEGDTAQAAPRGSGPGMLTDMVTCGAFFSPDPKQTLSPKLEVVKDLPRVQLIDVGKHKKNPADEDTVSPGQHKARAIAGLGPGQTFGTSALETCIGVVVIDGANIYVAHIMPGNDASAMLDRLLAGVGTGAIAVVAGGNDDGPSVDQLKNVLAKLKAMGITLHGFADCSGIHVQKDDHGLLQFVRYTVNELKSAK